jgi:rod shape-determining protein MreD
MERTGHILGMRILSSSVPVALGVLGAIVANFPVSFVANLLPPPLLSFMPLYFWGIVRPDLMSPAWAIMLGLLEDFLSGGPPGIWAASYLAAYAFLDSQRDMLAGLSGVGALLGFALSALVACTCAYVIFVIYHMHFEPVAPVMAELVTTVFLYVFAVFALGSIHRRLVGPLRSDF